jgi:glutamate--cysteine ligase catalytic subunit
MQDVNTKIPFRDDFCSYGVSNWEEYVRGRVDGYIHLDSSSIGWGCCCLQVTFQAASFDESLYLYDQLIPLTPIFVRIFYFIFKKIFQEEDFQI